jgi:hypothetical protein
MAGGDHVLLTNWRHLPEEWISADAEVRCGPWQGRLRVSFYGGNALSIFAEELKQLYRELHGTAILAATEPRLSIRLTGNGRGGITVEGEAQSDFVNETELHFQFTIDQTFLPGIADGISKLAHRND